MGPHEKAPVCCSCSQLAALHGATTDAIVASDGDGLRHLSLLVGFACDIAEGCGHFV